MSFFERINAGIEVTCDKLGYDGKQIRKYTYFWIATVLGLLAYFVIRWAL